MKTLTGVIVGMYVIAIVIFIYEAIHTAQICAAGGFDKGTMTLMPFDRSCFDTEGNEYKLRLMPVEEFK